jgi:hypothetical protein
MFTEGFVYLEIELVLHVLNWWVLSNLQFWFNLLVYQMGIIKLLLLFLFINIYIFVLICSLRSSDLIGSVSTAMIFNCLHFCQYLINFLHGLLACNVVRLYLRFCVCVCVCVCVAVWCLDFVCFSGMVQGL